MTEIKRTHNQTEMTVSQLSATLKRAVEDQFGYVRVRGELAGFKVHTSGHAYFKLKDDTAVLDGVCWRGTIGKIPFKPEDGMEIVCAGKLTTYAGRSQYQMVVEYMEPAGVGALMAMLEQRRKKLEAEGLFSPERIQALPFLPRVIGVVTSPTGAVIRDILHRIADRFPTRVVVWPVLVQGEGAAEQIAAAIRGFNALPCHPLVGGQKDNVFLGGAQDVSNPPHDSTIVSPAPPQVRSKTPYRPDLLIVARGGGSVEDLWAFNEEIVVRAAAESDIPLISAVGHETDTTLIDFAADVRAPTPTAAAEMALPVREELLMTVEDAGRRAKMSVSRLFMQASERVRGLARGLPNPTQMLEHAMQRLDDWSERLIGALPLLLDKKNRVLQVLTAALAPQTLYMQVTHQQQTLGGLSGRMHQGFLNRLAQREQKLETLTALLSSLNYRSVLARGFAIVRGADGTVVHSAKTMREEAAYTVTLQDGDVEVIVK